jgi:ribosomal protein L7/L12
LPEHLSAVRQLLRDGQRMQAIQVFRQATGASLAQAVDAIDLLEKSRGQIDVSTQGAVDLSRVQQLLREGRKIHAIAAYRDQTGVGLKEAKEAVEAIAAATSGVPASLAQPKPLTERLGCLGMALGLVVVFLAFSGGCGAVAKNTGLYRCAMSELRNHPGLIEQLGQPVRAGALVFVGGFSYESSFDGASQTAMEFYTPASGPKGRGLLSVSAAGDSEGEAGMRSRLLIGGHWVTVSNWRGLTCP